MKKPILHTLGFAVIAVFFFVFCADDAPDGSEGGQVDALLSKFYNKETPNVPNVPTYTVTFNSNDGTGTVPAAKSVSANNSITLPEKGNLSKGELVFNGWNTKSDGTGTNHPAGTVYTVTGNITLYATWKEASTGGGDETGLVLAAGEAWVSGDSGYIFTSSNRIIKIHNVLDGWWYADTSIYQTVGDIITINSIQWIYSISGNELNIGICSSCIFTKTSGVEPKTGFPSFTDTRDGNSYRLVRLGTQVWFAENLNYEADGSVCYGDDPANCMKYGRLYDWNTATTVCPTGYHLPKREEWQTLLDYVGDLAETKLKSKNGWNDNNGTDEYRFSALPGGFYSSGWPRYQDLGYGGDWWHESRGLCITSGGCGSYSYVDYSGFYVVGSMRQDNLLSVRCVQNNKTYLDTCATNPKPGCSNYVLPKTYIIRFDVNGGNALTPNTATTDTNGKLASLPNPTRSDHTFKGWYTATTGGDIVTVNKEYSAHTTIFAQWTVYVYTGGTVNLGNQTWMTENLNRVTENSRCYNNSADSCEKYGRLYTWADANTACPSGWRLPTDVEWTALTNEVGEQAGKKLKATSGWNSYNGVSGNGTDDYGFSALPGGYWDGWNEFRSVGDIGYWWSATNSYPNPWVRVMKYNDDSVSKDNDYGTLLFSVRCVQNN